MSRASAHLLPAVVALLAAAGSAAAQPGPAQVDVPFEQYTLPNGLRVVLAPDPTSPVVAVNLWYDVGSRNERAGRTGFAHLFEHMMFEGSENAPKGQHSELLREAGATNLNASTNEDRTNYYQVVPPHRLNLALWLEADRMRSLNVRAEQLRNQQEIVKEERRLRVDNAPYTGSFLRALFGGVYDAEGCFPYAHDIIGSMEDLGAAELSDVQEFFRTYYAPNNATLTLVGGFDPASARQMVEEYFGSIPAAAPAPPVVCENPFRGLPRRESVEDRNATLPAFLASYGAVQAGHPDSYALELLGIVLGGGESSRLNQRLVKDERAASAVFAGAQIRRGPGVFVTYALANQGVDAARLEALIGEEVAKVRDRGITAAELSRAKNRFRAQTIRAMETAMGRAEALQRYALFFRDPGAMKADLARYDAVTREDVQRVARQYLTDQNRAVIVTVPAPKS
ncbi:MAG TPA: pitrilysin family protein [Longimicrobium sp.]|nr:pitrilysin family protein [Longimicrobium sp.]